MITAIACISTYIFPKADHTFCMGNTFLYWLPLAVLLMPLNWFLEMMKWNALLDSGTKPGKFILLKAVFAGITCSIFTPNRSGECIGRAMYLTQTTSHVIVSSLLGGVIQFLVILLGGVSAFLWMIGIPVFHQIQGLNFFREISNKIPISHGLNFKSNLLFWCALGIMVVWILYYFWKSSDRFQQWILLQKKYLIEIRGNPKQILMAFAFGSLRWLVYTFQYVVCLWVFGMEGSLIQLWAGVMILMAVQALIPLPPIGTVPIRMGMAGAFWFFFGMNPWSGASASLLLWCINIGLPALIGVQLLGKKLPQWLEYSWAVFVNKFKFIYK